MKNIKLIEVPSEIGAGTRGASLGIEAIKIARNRRFCDHFSGFCQGCGGSYFTTFWVSNGQFVASCTRAILARFNDANSRICVASV